MRIMAQGPCGVNGRSLLGGRGDSQFPPGKIDVEEGAILRAFVLSLASCPESGGSGEEPS
jgi:hypothetical protein